MKKVKEIATLPLRDEVDISAAVDTGRAMASTIGLGSADWIQLETIMVEFASSALRSGGGGTVTLQYVERTPRPAAPDNLPVGALQPGLEISVDDSAPCAIDLAMVLAERCGASDGIGLNISSMCQLSDEFEIDSKMGHGLCVRARKWAQTVLGQGQSKEWALWQVREFLPPEMAWFGEAEPGVFRTV